MQIISQDPEIVDGRTAAPQEAWRVRRSGQPRCMVSKPMANFMLLLRAEAQVTDIEIPDDAFEKMVEWAKGLHEQKLLRGVSPLQREGATTLRYRRGSFVVDGPFAEGKEAVLGYFIIEVATRAEATAIFEHCPAMKWGGECGEILEMGDFPAFSD
jgi:hypothetical protein